MLGRNMEFRIVAQHTQHAVSNLFLVLQSLGITLTNLREADIVADADGSKHGDVYILCCEGTKRAYRKFMEEYSMTEIMYEGVKTLM